MSETTVKDVLNMARNDKAHEFSTGIGSLLKQRLFAAIANKKQELSKTLFSKKDKDTQGE
jgi:hypothetical protein